jgi:ubiquinone/menaquinone biosynthesis C-methylase UbiE
MVSPEESISFDRAADFYDATRGFAPGHDGPAVQQFIDAGKLTAQSRVLEIGVGTGRIALPLQQRLGCFYAGIDIAQAMLSKLVVKPGAEAISPVLADATAVPFASGTFDAVIAVHIFHLIPAYADALREVMRILKPGGLLLHGWGQRIQLAELEAVWEEHAGRTLNRLGNWYSQDDRSPFLDEMGWIAAGEIHRYVYPDARSPMAMVNSIEQGHWSNLWRMPRDVIEAGVAALRSHIAEHYPNPTEPVPMQQTFRVQAYRPPQ